MWQKIWIINLKEAGRERNFVAGFELYYQRANDYNNAVLDIYIGIK